MKKVELLCPVGNMETLFAAIHNGADAVYLGGKKYGARAFSENFTDEEMIEAIEYCHLYGVKIYITVNTIVYQKEISSFIDYIDFLYKHHVDALILQDIGMLYLIKFMYPDFEIHMSTQAHNHNTYGIQQFKELGASRVVFGREEALEDIKNISVDIEKEVFVYGALCACYSGNCLFSSLNGGRSGNRGECTQSCRLPYTLQQENSTIKKGYLLSTKDLNTLDYLKDLLSSDIDSLKIEGRMKSKEYVACVTRIYRRLIDAYYEGKNILVTEKERMDLLKLFNRSFTKGYLFGEHELLNVSTSNHQGIEIGKVEEVREKDVAILLFDDLHQEDGIRFKNSQFGMTVNKIYDKTGKLINHAKKGNRIYVDKKGDIKKRDIVLKTSDVLLLKELNQYEERKIPVRFTFYANVGKEMRLEVTDGMHTISCSSIIVEKARTVSTSRERVEEQLQKLGNTPFICASLQLHCDDTIFIPIKELNQLRRDALDLLKERRIYRKQPITPLKNKINMQNTYCKNPKISVLVRNEMQLKTCLDLQVDMLYTPNEDLYEKYKDKCTIYLRLERVKHSFKEYKQERLLCSELGSFYKYKDTNDVKLDYYMNIVNDYSLHFFKEHGISSACLSIECKKEDMLSIANKDIVEILVYGYVESMIIKNNVFKIENKDTTLVDLKKNVYPLQFDGEVTHIFHHQPINHIAMLSELKGFKYYRIELFDETEKEITSLINEVKNVLYLNEE